MRSSRGLRIKAAYSYGTEMPDIAVLVEVGLVSFHELRNSVSDISLIKLCFNGS